jgi:hypothetical protein
MFCFFGTAASPLTEKENMKIQGLLRVDGSAL